MLSERNGVLSMRRAQQNEQLRKEKDLLKGKLLELIQVGTEKEVHRLLEVQLAEVIAKIARSDWPDQWAPLFPALK
jgi:hypothetical protein